MGVCLAKGLDAMLYPTRLDYRPTGSPNSLIFKRASDNRLDEPPGGSSNTPLSKASPNKGMKGRWFDGYLRVRGWDSEYPSVQRMLDHLSRRTKSESSRIQYLQTLATLCRKEERTPDQLTRLSRQEAEDAVQSFLDTMAKQGRSKRWVNVCMAQLITFFRVNGFKRQKELELERHYLPVRYRKRPEYIPLSSEINRMTIAGRNPSEKATVLLLYESGLRNSTARAVRYGDVKAELDAGLDIVHVPVRSTMKEVDPDAAKGGVEYDPFMGREAARAVKEQVRYVEAKTGRAFPLEWPLFPGQHLDGSPTKKASLAAMVKRLARTAGVERWRDVYPHCLRKAFENAVRNSGLDWKDQEILMGHILPGSMDTYLDKTRTEEFREKYGRVRFFPEGTVTKNELLAAIRREMLATSHSDEELDRLGDLSKLTSERFVEVLNKKALGLNGNGRQKAVPAAEVRAMVESGWEYVAQLPDGSVVMRMPGGPVP